MRHPRLTVICEVLLIGFVGLELGEWCSCLSPSGSSTHSFCGIGIGSRGADKPSPERLPVFVLRRCRIIFGIWENRQRFLGFVRIGS